MGFLTPCGQASFRLHRTEYLTDAIELAYIKLTRQISVFTAAYSASDTRYTISALYTGYLIRMETTTNISQDSLNNVTIPTIGSLIASASSV